LIVKDEQPDGNLASKGVAGNDLDFIRAVNQPSVVLKALVRPGPVAAAVDIHQRAGRRLTDDPVNRFGDAEPLLRKHFQPQVSVRFCDGQSSISPAGLKAIAGEEPV